MTDLVSLASDLGLWLGKHGKSLSVDLSCEMAGCSRSPKLIRYSDSI
jgi:hypothetical protein